MDNENHRDDDDDDDQASHRSPSPGARVMMAPADRETTDITQALANQIIEQENYENALSTLKDANALLLTELRKYKSAHEDILRNLESVRGALLQRDQDLIEKDKLLTRLKETFASSDRIEVEKARAEKKITEKFQEASEKLRMQNEFHIRELARTKEELLDARQCCESKDADVRRFKLELVPSLQREISALKKKLLSASAQGEPGTGQVGDTSLDAEVRQLQREKSILDKKVENLEEALREARERPSANEDVHRLREASERHKMVDHLSVGLQKEQDRARSQVSVLRNKLAGLNGEKLALQSKLQAAENEAVRLSDELRESQDELASRLAIQEAQSRERILVLERERDQAAHETEHAHVALEAEKNSSQRQRAQLEVANQQLTDRLRLEKESDADKLSRLANDKKAAEMLAEDLRKTTNESSQQQRKQLQHAESELDRLRGELENKGVEMGQLRVKLAKVSVLESRVAELEQQNRKLRETLLQHEQERERERLQQRNERAGVDELRKSRTDLVQQLDETRRQREIDQLRAEALVDERLKEYGEREKMLQGTADDAQDTCKELGATLEAERSRAADRERQWQEKCSRIKQTQALLESEVERLSAKQQSTEKFISPEKHIALQNEMEALKKKHQMFRNVLLTSFCADGKAGGSPTKNAFLVSCRPKRSDGATESAPPNALTEQVEMRRASPTAIDEVKRRIMSLEKNYQ